MCGLIVTTLILIGASLPSGAGLWADRTVSGRSLPTSESQAGAINRQPARRTAAGLSGLRGDFPEYRPGARAAGLETFWR